MPNAGGGDRGEEVQGGGEEDVAVGGVEAIERGPVATVKEEEATEGGGLDEGGGELGEGGGIEVEVQQGGEEEIAVGGVEIEEGEGGVREEEVQGGGEEEVAVGGVKIKEGEEVAMEDDGHRTDKASIMEHNTGKYDVEEELAEHRVEEGDGGNTGEGEALQLEIVLGRGEDADAAMSGEWG